MAIRSLQTIINDAIAYLTLKKPGIATFSGTVTRDVVIEAPAQEFDKVYQELSHTQQLQSLNYADNMSTDELDAFANNYALTRLTGTTSQGTVTFQIRNYNSGSSLISIPTGSVLATQGSDQVAQVTFLTSQAITFLPSLAPAYFNPITGLYEQTATIAAQIVGSASNVAAGTVTQLLTSVPGIDSLINTVATTGGTDTETNSAFADRIRIKLSGNSIGTPNGILSLVETNANVRDAVTVTPNDIEMIRNEFGGSVDVYILGEILDTTSEVRLYQTAGDQEFILQHQPAKTISSITGIVSAAPYTFIQGVDYDYVLDTTILFNGSTQLENKVVFNIGGSNPDNNSNIIITYVYNSLVESLQTILDTDNQHIITADILVKESKEAVIDIIADVSLFSGFTPSTEVANIQTALSTYIDGLGLGQSINRSDVVSIIEGVGSVDQVDLNTLTLSKNGTPIALTDQRIQIFKTEYARSNTININVL